MARPSAGAILGQRLLEARRPGMVSRPRLLERSEDRPPRLPEGWAAPRAVAPAQRGLRTSQLELRRLPRSLLRRQRTLLWLCRLRQSRWLLRVSGLPLLWGVRLPLLGLAGWLRHGLRLRLSLRRLRLW